ncbi:MAG: fused MFS/spermidine synthase, partial [Pseudomonadota bacterium]
SGLRKQASEPEESIVFYEIDPVIDRIARDPNHFTFMSRCAPNAKTVMGDARLTLNKEKNALYDYLVIDAFSSDAVPAHLLSREALAMYLTKIKPDGLIAMHISNRHMELESVIAATAETLPGIHAVFVDHRKAKLSGDAIPSDVLFLTRNKATADTLMTWWDARAADPKTTTPWSDDYADVISAIWRRYSEDH